MKPSEMPEWVRRGRGLWTDFAAWIRWELRHPLMFSSSSFFWRPSAWSDLLVLTPHTAIPRPGDSEVQPAASESASQPTEGRTAARHAGGQRSDRLHLRSPRTLCSSSAGRMRLRQRVFTDGWTQKSWLFTSLPLTASPLSLPICSFTGSSSTSSSPTSPASSAASSLRGPAAGWGEGHGQPTATPWMRVWISTLGSVFPSILWQQSAADGEEEAEEDGLAGLVAVEERWGGQQMKSLWLKL